MSVSPVNITRLSHNLRANLVVGSLRQNQLDVFTEQTRIATGRAFITPSENPVAAARVLDLSRALAQQGQFAANLRHADNNLAASDEALTEVNSLLIEAATIASENVSNLTSADERASVAELIAGIRVQLQNVGNRVFNGRYLFAGRDTLDRPFVEALGGIAYTGDTGDLLTRATVDQSEAINLPGNLLYGAMSQAIGGRVDLSPLLSSTARLDELSGAAGRGIQPGTLVFNEIGGAGVFAVDVGSADTIADVVDAINNAATTAGADVTAALSDTGLVITPGANAITITDGGTGGVAGDLGILTTAPASTLINGGDLNARLTPLTPLAELAGGAAIDLTSGFVLTNGSASATIDLSAAETVQDLLNAVNNAGAYVLARINAAGTGVELFNRISGTALSIGENGGTTAEDLGLRTFGLSTPLADLNGGRGVTNVTGAADFQITTSSGATVDVDLDSAATVGDVITLINDAANAAGVGVTASLAAIGNGIVLTDTTTGTDPFRVASLNLSQAALDLGLQQVAANATTGTLAGADNNPVRTDGILSALLELEHALRRDDTQGIALAAERLDPFTKDLTRIHGVIGARSQAMRSKLNQSEDAANATRIFLSEIQDLDYAGAITRMQSATTQLQANLQTSSVLLDLSLLDFLR